MTPRICIVTTSEMTMRAFLVDQVRALARAYDVTLVSNFENASFWTDVAPSLRIEQIRFARPIAPRNDAASLAALIRLFRASGFDLVHSVTPKAGLLAAIAGKAAGVPIRVHTCTGQVWATRRGLRRAMLRSSDRLMVSMLTDVLVDSASQRKFLEDNGVLERGAAVVLGDGSISGVDLRRFSPDPTLRARMRTESGVAADDVVFLFLGRLTRDKGIFDLAAAFRTLAAEEPRARLVVVGPDEEHLGATIRQELGASADRTIFVGHTDRPEDYMRMADVLCLPSFREGFGSVIIEAAAVGIPAIASRVYGIVDAVEDGIGGMLVPAGSATDLHRAMRTLAEDESLRRRLGCAARDRAVRAFGSERLTSELLDFYARRLGSSRS
jgi:glycosyltransferase involved in cell wall biosynthesis